MINSSKKRQDFWNNSETDLSLTSDSDSKPEKQSSMYHDNLSLDQSNENLSSKCCLICSILPSLSNINCCTEHLSLLIQKPSTSMENHQHLSIKSKENIHRYEQKKRSLILKSFNTIDTNNYFQSLSSNEEQSTIENQFNHSSMNHNQNNNYLRKRRRKFIQNQTLISIDNNHFSYTPRILLKRVIHVKDDDDEQINVPQSQITLNMIQATQQMSTQNNIQPKIHLKRICLEE